MSKQLVSVVYITLNAEKYLEKSLDSVKSIAQEVLIVDCGSTDQTLSIAHKFEAKVIYRAWEGFAAQRQFAVDSACCDWVLMLDADEILTEPGVQMIDEALSDPADVAAYFLRRLSVFHDKKILHGDWGRDRVLRLFDRRQGKYTDNLVHEAWETCAPIKALPGISMLHYSYKNYAELLDKMRRYAILNAQQLHLKGRIVRAHMPMTHAIAALLRSYFLRLGMLDGVEGAAIAWTIALGAFMKYAIALEMQAQDKDAS
ncbi:lipopolysaccharide biosynthesis protein [Acidithiobacillus marinus]|uniref:Lipopolysaccharide biosynthesis protein n=1 Tax=Acidithiobacillus marinus TaxID=187490 RepID=A0A2I1DPY7_9PROT|nr:glycosyltransferase family 2 protein [Acidithiobacillus marinus]PKY11945.1 lipopolysaccharide biosynthesis protein [Acidithiobacillus marinus]